MINANGYGYTDPSSQPASYEPQSQADCPKGTTFISAEALPLGTPAYCQKELTMPQVSLPDGIFGRNSPQSQADCPAGTEFFKYEGCPPGWPQELGCQPRVYTECRPIGKPDLSEDTPTPTQSASPKNYFWLYAIAVGVGFYLLTRKKSV